MREREREKKQTRQQFIVNLKRQKKRKRSSTEMTKFFIAGLDLHRLKEKKNKQTVGVEQKIHSDKETKHVRKRTREIPIAHEGKKKVCFNLHDDKKVNKALICQLNNSSLHLN